MEEYKKSEKVGVKMEINFKRAYYGPRFNLKKENEEIRKIKERLMNHEVIPFFGGLSFLENSPEKILLEFLEHCQKDMDFRFEDKTDEKDFFELIKSKLESGLNTKEKFELKSILIENNENILNVLDFASKAKNSDLSLTISSKDIIFMDYGYYINTINFKNEEVPAECEFKTSTILHDDLINILLFLILSYWFSRFMEFVSRQ